MSTQRIFWSDPYLTRLVTRITRVEDAKVQVAETIFFAESGGQESDAGTIGDKAVQLAELADGDLIYTLEKDHLLKTGDEVEIVIDWPRRHALMRLHFAAEIVLEVCTQHFGLKDKIGAHIGPERARIDFAHGVPLTPILDAIRGRAQAFIDRDLPIETGYTDADLHRRFWRVEELAQVPCGGTHLKRTGEVGTLMLRRKNVGRGKERIEITLS